MGGAWLVTKPAMSMRSGEPLLLSSDELNDIDQLKRGWNDVTDQHPRPMVLIQEIYSWVAEGW